MKIFLISPLKPEYRDISDAVKEAACSDYGKYPSTLISPEDFIITGLRHEKELQKEIENSDLIIADVSENNSYNIFELGFAKAANKPVLFIAKRESTLPFFISSNYLIHYYDRNRLKETLVVPLINQLAKINLNELSKGLDILQKSISKTVFISYSHEDKEYLKRLIVHLRPFEKLGRIDIWSDDKIKAGEKWKEAIEKALNKAAIAILLISADFLASDFIVDNELPPLLKYAEEKGTVILPVILKPCLFKYNVGLSQFQSINDPKTPMSKLIENDREEIFVKIAEEINSLLK
jgi:hypothetical protein